MNALKHVLYKALCMKPWVNQQLPHTIPAVAQYQAYGAPSSAIATCNL